MGSIHRSHISSKRAKAQGWGRVPLLDIRQETRALRKEVGVKYMDGNYVSWVDSNSCTSLGTTATWGGAWSVDPAVNYEYQPTVIREIIREKEVTKEVEKRTLFRVYVVNPKKNGSILMDGKLVIALNENQAMLKAGVAQVADREGLDLEQVDVYVDCIGTFIRPRKETQRVRIAKTDEDD